MQEIDAIQNKRESKIISSINNDTSENGYIVFDYREKSGYRNFDTQDWLQLIVIGPPSWKPQLGLTTTANCQLVEPKSSKRNDSTIGKADLGR